MHHAEADSQLLTRVTSEHHLKYRAQLCCRKGMFSREGKYTLITVKQGLGFYGAQGLANNPYHSETEPRRREVRFPDRNRKDNNSKEAYVLYSNIILL